MVDISKIKPVSRARLEQELNSDTFISGIKAMCDYSKRTGKEVGFIVHYYPEIDVFHYPTDIEVGITHPVKSKKEKETSLVALAEDDSGLPIEIESYEKPSGIDFPRTEKWIRNSKLARQYAYAMLDNKEEPPFYPALRVRTDPGSRLFSLTSSDLQALSFETEVAENVMIREGVEVPLMPISIIAQPKKEKHDKIRYNRLLLIQQKEGIRPNTEASEHSLKIITEAFTPAEAALYKLIYKKESTFFGGIPYNRIESSVRDRYNLCNANSVYFPEKRLADENHLYCPADLSMFCKGK